MLTEKTGSQEPAEAEPLAGVPHAVVGKLLSLGFVAQKPWTDLFVSLRWDRSNVRELYQMVVRSPLEGVSPQMEPYS